MKSYLIGIAGGSGSGKSTFATSLAEQFPDEVALIRCDNYYRANDGVPLEVRKHMNYDAPEAIEFSLMQEQLQMLQQGETIQSPLYDFSIHNRSEQTKEIESRPIIIVDGILLFAVPELRDLFDLKIYVESDADERILRRARRDILERGRSIENVMEQYLATVKPMHNLYVEPTKVYADLVVHGGMNPVSIDVVACKIASVLSGQSD